MCFFMHTTTAPFMAACDFSLFYLVIYESDKKKVLYIAPDFSLLHPINMQAFSVVAWFENLIRVTYRTKI